MEAHKVCQWRGWGYDLISVSHAVAVNTDSSDNAGEYFAGAATAAYCDSLS
jgi:hypothetical protein